MLGSKAEEKKDPAVPEPQKKKRKVIVRKIVVKKTAKPETTPAAAAASGSSERHEASSDTVPSTLEETQTIPATLQESEAQAPKQAVWAGWDRYRVQRQFDRPGIPQHAGTKTPSPTPSPPAAPVPAPAESLAPPSDGAPVASDPNAVAGAGDANTLDGLEEELGKILDSMEAEADTPPPAAATATTDSDPVASQWHPAHDLVKYGQTLKAWVSALPEPATQKMIQAFRQDHLLPEYEGIYGKLPEVDGEWMDHWVNFSCWKITQHPERSSDAGGSNELALPPMPPDSIWHPSMRKAMRGVPQVGAPQAPDPALAAVAASSSRAEPDTVPAASATPAEPEMAPQASAPEASATLGGPETAPAASATSAEQETAPAASKPETAPAASATQAELETAPAASATSEAATEATRPAEQAEVGGASEASWWGKWTEAEWKAWNDGTWWEQERPEWSTRKHTHSTPPESAAGTPREEDLRDALSRMSTVDLEGTPKSDPATPPPPPAMPTPTPEEKKEVAKRAHARYMRYYRSTRESAGHK